VGDDSLDIVLLAEVRNIFASGEDGDNLPRAVSDLLLIPRPLVSVVSSIEQGAVYAENFVDYETKGFVYVASLVMNTATQVIHHGVIEGVGGFGVDCEVVVFALVHCGFLSLCLFDYVLIIYLEY
jgi:hypothetical protein